MCLSYSTTTCQARGNPEISKQTGPPESEDCSDDHDQDNEDEDEVEVEVAHDDDYRRRTCPTCKRKSMVKLSELPKPTVYEMMQLKIWPEQYGYRRQDAAESIRRQPLLKDVTPYLPGGTEFVKGVAARLEQLQSLEYS